MLTSCSPRFGGDFFFDNVLFKGTHRQPPLHVGLVVVSFGDILLCSIAA